MFRFRDPALFLLLLSIIFILPKNRGRVLFSSLAPIKTAIGSGGNLLKMLYFIPRIMVIVCLVIAVARPQLGDVRRDVNKEGIDIILCLDTSGSMDALDFTIGDKRASRLQVVKSVVSEFVKKRDGDRIGLVAFGSEAVTRTPLTGDYELLESAVADLTVGMVGDSTAVGVALALSLKRIEGVEGKSKIVILLTDGVSNSGNITPDMALDMAASLGVKVYTIGVGTNALAPFMVDTPFGKRLINQRVELDEEILKKIAKVTGGKYYRASNTEKLKNIYDEIDKLEKTIAKTEEHITFSELYIYPLWIGLFFLILEILLLNTRFQKLAG